MVERCSQPPRRRPAASRLHLGKRPGVVAVRAGKPTSANFFSTPTSSMPMACRWCSCRASSTKPALPERVCTTDLFHDVARIAQQRGARFFMLGATQSVVTQAACARETLYPDLNIVGYSSGYLRRDDDEDKIIDAINSGAAGYPLVGFRRAARADFRHAQSGSIARRRTDQDLRRLVRLSLREEFARTGLDAKAPGSNGPIEPISSRGVSPAAIS